MQFLGGGGRGGGGRGANTMHYGRCAIGALLQTAITIDFHQWAIKLL